MGLSLWWFGKVAALRQQVGNSNNLTTPFWVWEMVFPILIFSVFSGIRWQVGVDHLNYLEGYKTLQTGGTFLNRDIEFGFYFISNFFVQINAHFVLYFAFWAFLQLFFVYYAFKDERYLLPYLGLLIIFSGEYLSWMNGIRQMLAATMFVYSIQFIKDRKLFKYIITIFIASLFHKSAIALIVFYFIPQKDFCKYRLLNLTLLTICFVVGLTPQFSDMMGVIGKMLAFAGYDNYSENIQLFYAESIEMNLGPRRIILLLMNIISIWQAPKLNNYFKSTNYVIYFNLSFLGILLFNLFANTGHIFLRPVSYFAIFQIIVNSYLLVYLRKKSSEKLSLNYIAMLILSLAYLIFTLIADAGKEKLDFSNFKFFWDYV